MSSISMPRTAAVNVKQRQQPPVSGTVCFDLIWLIYIQATASFRHMGALLRFNKTTYDGSRHLGSGLELRTFLAGTNWLGKKKWQTSAQVAQVSSIKTFQLVALSGSICCVSMSKEKQGKGHTGSRSWTGNTLHPELLVLSEKNSSSAGLQTQCLHGGEDGSETHSLITRVRRDGLKRWHILSRMVASFYCWAGSRYQTQTMFKRLPLINSTHFNPWL